MPPPPPPKPFRFPTAKAALYAQGVFRIARFCRLNGLPVPGITEVPRADWQVNACAFYRPDTEREARYRLPGHGPGVNVCVDLCRYPAGEAVSRNWSWPGSAVDRTPFGVLAHELGHHADWHVGERKGRYYSEWCEQVKAAAGEPGLTSYADENPAEYLAEAFRLYVTNPGLLRELRPRTYNEIGKKFRPAVRLDWRWALGANVPARVVRALENKGAK